jgi:hypothetical protein
MISREPPRAHTRAAPEVPYPAVLKPCAAGRVNGPGCPRVG